MFLLSLRRVLPLVLGALVFSAGEPCSPADLAAPMMHEAEYHAATHHQLWLVSTRQASSCAPSPKQATRLTYAYATQSFAWVSASLADFLAADDPAVTTCVYVHENRISWSESKSRAKHIFSQLSRAVPPGDRFRLVVLSWPADRIGRRQRPDVQAKAIRSEMHGYYLAWLLDQINPNVPIAMYGHSYGPRMITAALHCLGGGSINGRRLDRRASSPRRQVRVALMAAAIDSHWLYSGQHHGRALSQLETVLVVYNPRDYALRWYPRLWGRGGPEALGYLGVTCTARLGEHLPKISQVNVSSWVGKAHDWRCYEGSSTMMKMVAKHLFGDVSPSQTKDRSAELAVRRTDGASYQQP